MPVTPYDPKEQYFGAETAFAAEPPSPSVPLPRPRPYLVDATPEQLHEEVAQQRIDQAFDVAAKAENADIFEPYDATTRMSPDDPIQAPIAAMQQAFKGELPWQQWPQSTHVEVRSPQEGAELMLGAAMTKMERLHKEEATRSELSKLAPLARNLAPLELAPLARKR